MKQYGRIVATASAVPPLILTNDDLATWLDTSHEWINERTGIYQRHCVTNQTTSDLCIEVAKKLIDKAHIQSEELDFIIVATMSPDYTSPSVAAILQGAIGATSAIAFDISAACSGFVYALSIAEKFIQAGSSKGLVIGGEVLSKLIDWQDRQTAVLFGDGAGGVLVVADEKPMIIKESLKADGQRSQALTAGFVPNHSRFFKGETSETLYLKMNGRGIYDFALRDVTANLKAISENQSVDYFLLHQANQRIIEKIAKKIAEPYEKFLINLDRYGNTSAASIPILLDEAVNQQTITLTGQQTIVLTGYGGGLTWGSLLCHL